MKWQPENEYSSEYRLVTDDGEIVAEISHHAWRGKWYFGVRSFVSAEAAKAAAERSVATP